MSRKTKEYYESPRISNSLLGSINNPRLFKMKMDGLEPKEDKNYFRIGSAVDCLLTDPESFEEDFKIIDVNRPQGLLGKFVEALPSHVTPVSPAEDYQEAYDFSEYKISIDWVIRKFWSSEDAVKYFEIMKSLESDGRSVLSKDEYLIVETAVASIVNNEFTRPYFHIDPEDDHVELLHQFPVYFEYRSFECKALLDGIRINHIEKTIEPFDLKTTGKSVYSFMDSFLTYGYFRQAAFYTYAIQHDLSPIKDLFLQGYRLLPFNFIAVETRPNSTHPPVIYRVSDQDLACGFKGGRAYGKLYKGIDQLLDDYIWHKENDLWDMPRELYEAHGVIDLKVLEDG